jgi:hypothetical protein
MRLGICFLAIVLVYCSAAYPDGDLAADNELAARRYLFLQYINEVQLSLAERLPDWADELMKATADSRFTGLRTHATPFNESLLPRKRRTWLLFTSRLSYGSRTSESHLETVRSVAAEVRNQEAFAELKSKSRYVWSEKDFGILSDLLSEKITDESADLALKVEAFHSDHRSPSSFENEALLNDYLKVWILGALWQVESERYLSAFPIKGAHRDRARESQESSSEKIGECRIAIIRMAYPGYHW